MFQNFISKLSKLRGGAENTAVGIDIGSSGIKIVEIKRKSGKAILETYGAIALGPYDGLDAGRVTNLSVEKVAEALKEVLKQSGATVGEGTAHPPIPKASTSVSVRLMR